MNPTTYRCRQCQKEWPKDQMGDGLYGRLKYCPECNSLCDPITEPPQGAQAETQINNSYPLYDQPDPVPSFPTPRTNALPVPSQVTAFGAYQAALSSHRTIEIELHSALLEIGRVDGLFSVAMGRAEKAESALTASREECERIAKQLESSRAHNEKEWNKWYSNVPGTEGHELRTLRAQLAEVTRERDEARVDAAKWRAQEAQKVAIATQRAAKDEADSRAGIRRCIDCEAPIHECECN